MCLPLATGKLRPSSYRHSLILCESKAWSVTTSRFYFLRAKAVKTGKY